MATVTIALVRRLLSSPAEEPVLYIDTDSDTPDVDVWARALVPPSAVVISRSELIDWIGDDPDADTISEYLPELQVTVDRVADVVAPEQDEPHFTAWLVNDPSALDGENCDVTVIADEVISYDRDEDGEETPVWASNGRQVFYAVTGISARDGDIDKALQEAGQLLAAAGWRLAGKWEAADNAYLVTVGRIDEQEEWTLEETAARIGATSTGSARKMLSRWGVAAVRREPGRGGQSVYNALQVLVAKGARPGQGARTDLEADQ